MEFIDKKRLKHVIILGVLLVAVWTSFFIGARVMEAKHSAPVPAPSISTTPEPEVVSGR